MRRLERSTGATVRAVLAAATVTLAGCGISTQRELEIGQQYSAQINEQLPIVSDAAASQYINQVGNRIAQRGGRGLAYRFYIVNSELVNAFAVPGGFIYVNRGLIEATDNEAELAGVLAHEIAHVEQRHSVEQMERLRGANLGLTLAYVLLGRAPGGLERAAIDVGGGLVLSLYSREAENEADATAIPLLIAAGYDPNGLVTFFDELLAERTRRPSQLEQWFSTHPLTEDRIENTRRLVAQIPPSQVRGLATSSPAFASFKAKLRQYEAPPKEFRARD